MEPHKYHPNRGHGHGDQKEPGSGNRCLAPGCGLPESDRIHTIVEEIEAVKVGVAELKQAVEQPSPKSDWVGDSPFWLMCQTPADGNVGIDIDVPGWIEQHKELMRSPGTWFLMDKRRSKPIFSVVMAEGDQFYFSKHHVGNLMAAREVLCYGIGKKQADGSKVNLWLLPNGMVCGGGDVDILAGRMI
jgi:hypothetical protein